MKKVILWKKGLIIVPLQYICWSKGGKIKKFLYEYHSLRMQCLFAQYPVKIRAIELLFTGAVDLKLIFERIKYKNRKAHIFINDD